MRAALESSATEANVGWEKICSHDRLVISRKSHFLDMVQEARVELQNGEVLEEELEASIQVHMAPLLPAVPCARPSVSVSLV